MWGWAQGWGSGQLKWIGGYRFSRNPLVIRHNGRDTRAPYTLGTPRLGPLAPRRGRGVGG